MRSSSIGIQICSPFRGYRCLGELDVQALQISLCSSPSHRIAPLLVVSRKRTFGRFRRAISAILCGVRGC